MKNWSLAYKRRRVFSRTSPLNRERCSSPMRLLRRIRGKDEVKKPSARIRIFSTAMGSISLPKPSRQGWSRQGCLSYLPAPILKFQYPLPNATTNYRCPRPFRLVTSGLASGITRMQLGRGRSIFVSFPTGHSGQRLSNGLSPRNSKSA